MAKSLMARTLEGTVQGPAKQRRQDSDRFVVGLSIPETFDAYLQGYYFFQRNTDKDTDMAAGYYERNGVPEELTPLTEDLRSRLRGEELKAKP